MTSCNTCGSPLGPEERHLSPSACIEAQASMIRLLGLALQSEHEVLVDVQARVAELERAPSPAPAQAAPASPPSAQTPTPEAPSAAPATPAPQG